MIGSRNPYSRNDFSRLEISSIRITKTFTVCSSRLQGGPEISASINGLAMDQRARSKVEVAFFVPFSTRQYVTRPGFGA